ncbi:MAG: hypothetical protein PVI52_09400 [Chromatiales bacterium]
MFDRALLDVEVQRRNVDLTRLELHGLLEIIARRLVLRATGWHKGRACEILDVSRPRLQRMILEYGLKPPQGVPPNAGDEGDT